MDMDVDQREALLQISMRAQHLVAELMNGDTDYNRAYELVLQVRADANILKAYLRQKLVGPLEVLR